MHFRCTSGLCSCARILQSGSFCIPNAGRNIICIMSIAMQSISRREYQYVTRSVKRVGSRRLELIEQYGDYRSQRETRLTLGACLVRGLWRHTAPHIPRRRCGGRIGRRTLVTVRRRSPQTKQARNLAVRV